MVSAQTTGGQSRPGGRSVLVTPGGVEVGSAQIPLGGAGIGEQARNQLLAEARQAEAIRQQVLRNQERARQENLARQEKARLEQIRLEQIRADRLKSKLILERAQRISNDYRNQKGQIIREQVLINLRSNERIYKRIS